MNAEKEFEAELEVFRTESDAAVQFFYAWQTIHSEAADTAAVHKALNRSALFWNTTLGALQTSTMVVLGRIFDPDTSAHSVTRLMNLAMKHRSIFDKESHAERHRARNANADSYLADFLGRAYVPTVADLRVIKQKVGERRKLYERVYQPLRHKVFAHKSAEPGLDLLWQQTNIRDLQRLLAFLRTLHEALWQLYFNARKPNLRGARYSVAQMRIKPLASEKGATLQERIVRQTQDVMRAISDGSRTQGKR